MVVDDWVLIPCFENNSWWYYNFLFQFFLGSLTTCLPWSGRSLGLRGGPGGRGRGGQHTCLFLVAQQIPLGENEISPIQQRWGGGVVGGGGFHCVRGCRVSNSWWSVPGATSCPAATAEVETAGRPLMIIFHHFFRVAAFGMSLLNWFFSPSMFGIIHLNWSFPLDLMEHNHFFRGGGGGIWWNLRAGIISEPERAKMTRKCLKNDFKMTWNWQENVSKMTQKCHKNDSKMTQKCQKNDSKMTQKCHKNG